MKLFSNSGKRDGATDESHGHFSAHNAGDKPHGSSGELPPLSTEDISHVSPIISLSPANGESTTPAEAVGAVPDPNALPDLDAVPLESARQEILETIVRLQVPEQPLINEPVTLAPPQIPEPAPQPQAMQQPQVYTQQPQVVQQPQIFTQQPQVIQQQPQAPEPAAQPQMPQQPEHPAYPEQQPHTPAAGDAPIAHYPESTEWNEKQKRMLAMAQSSKSGDTGRLPTLSEETGFDHLKKQRKHPVKVFFITLLIIVLVGAAGFGGWYFWWTQYATFEYELQPVVILEGQTVLANEFLPASELSRGVTAAYQNPLFTPVPGPMTVPITLHLGLRSLETDATLYVLTPVEELIHEFRTEAPLLTPSDLITNVQIARNVPFDAAFSVPARPLDEYEVGTYTLELTLNGEPFAVRLIIEDTTAPIATPQDVTVRIGEGVPPDAFVADIFDVSAIDSIEFIGDNLGEPLLIAYQDQYVKLEITDIYGNTETFAGSLTVERNSQPPTISELPSVIESMVGTALKYPENVTAFDDFNREIEITVDDTQLDTSQAGEYTIKYIAQDFTGLTTEVDVTVFIIEIDPDEVDAWIDDKLASILTDGMSQEDRVRAIFDEVRKVATPSTTELDDTEWTGSLYLAAHWAINSTRAEYYHFYALSELMLSRAEIVNTRIERSEVAPSELPHIWSLVYYDGDGWYHYDSFHATDDREINSIQHKFTQAQAEEIEEHMEDERSFGKRGYYDYVASLFPTVKAE